MIKTKKPEMASSTIEIILSKECLHRVQMGKLHVLPQQQEHIRAETPVQADLPRDAQAQCLKHKGVIEEHPPQPPQILIGDRSLLGTGVCLPSTSLNLAPQPHYPQIEQPPEGLPGLGANGRVVGDGLEEDEELGLESQRLGVGGRREGGELERGEPGEVGRGRAGGGRRPEHARDAAPRGYHRAEEVRGEPRVGATAEAEERRAQGLELREEEVVRGHASEERGLPLRRGHGDRRGTSDSR